MLAKDTTDANTRKSGSTCLSLILVFIVLSFGAFPVLRLCIAHEERLMTVQVGKDIPANFPVLVFTSSDGNGHRAPVIVFYNDLKKYLKAHPDYSFMLPEDQVKQANADLRKYDYDFDSDNGPSYGVGKFTMAERDGKEYFKVEGSWDDDRVNIGWYEADKRSFTPEKYVTYFGPSLCMKYFPLIMLGNVIASLFIVVVAGRYRRKDGSNAP